MEAIKIGNKIIGPKRDCFIIGEVGLSHEGSLGTAMAFAKAIAEAGADAAKFQLHIAEAEGTREEKFRTRTFIQDASRQDYWTRTSFTLSQWKQLKKYTESLGLIFLCSPFSLKAVQVLKYLGVKAWKIGSGETNNIPLLETIFTLGQPVLVSTGMSTIAEIKNVVELAVKSKTPLILFQCTSRYPCPPGKLGLEKLRIFKEAYHCPVGFSDHSGRTAAALAARTLGADALEIHVTFSRSAFGPDVSSSLTLEDFAEVIRDIRYLEPALTTVAHKDKEAVSLKQMRTLFGKSVVASRELPKGKRILKSDLEFKKPGTGIPASQYRQLVGKTLRGALKKNQKFTWELLREG